MEEKQKMLSGDWYYPEKSEVLKKERLTCKLLCQKYNKMSLKKRKQMNKVMAKILGVKKGNFWIEPSFVCDYGYNIEVGNNFYANHNTVILDCAKVIFGDNVFIGPNCAFYTAIHPIDAKTRNSGLETSKPIVVGNNVWFGGNVTVLPGVTIGNNTVIGAGSVVTKNIPDNVIAVGNPCRVIKTIQN